MHRTPLFTQQSSMFRFKIEINVFSNIYSLGNITARESAKLGNEVLPQADCHFGDLEVIVTDYEYCNI